MTRTHFTVEAREMQASGISGGGQHRLHFSLDGHNQWYTSFRPGAEPHFEHEVEFDYSTTAVQSLRHKRLVVTLQKRGCCGASPVAEGTVSLFDLATGPPRRRIRMYDGGRFRATAELVIEFQERQEVELSVPDLRVRGVPAALQSSLLPGLSCTVHPECEKVMKQGQPLEVASAVAELGWVNLPRFKMSMTARGIVESSLRLYFLKAGMLSKTLLAQVDVPLGPAFQFNEVAHDFATTVELEGSTCTVEGKWSLHNVPTFMQMTMQDGGYADDVGVYNCAPAHHAVTQFPTNYAHPAVGAGAGAGTGAGAGAGATPALANPPSFTGHPAGYPAAGGYSASPAAYGGGAPAYHPHPPSPSYGDGGGYNPSPSAAPAISVPYGYSGHGDGFGGGARRNSGSSVASGRLTPVYRPVSPAAGDAQPARPARYHLTFTRPGPIGLTISESKPGAPFPATITAVGEPACRAPDVAAGDMIAAIDDNSTQHWAFADVIEALAQATRPLKVTCATMA